VFAVLSPVRKPIVFCPACRVPRFLGQFASRYFVARSPGVLGVALLRLRGPAPSRLVSLATCPSPSRRSSGSQLDPGPPPPPSTRPAPVEPTAHGPPYQ